MVLPVLLRVFFGPDRRWWSFGRMDGCLYNDADDAMVLRDRQTERSFLHLIT
jgi:hypothetical protein